MIRSKLGVVFGLVIVGLGAAVIFQYQTNQKLNEKNAELTRKLDQLSGLAKENERLSNLVRQASGQAKFSQDQMNELLRLRTESASARRQKDRRTAPGVQPERPPSQPEPSVAGTSLLSTNSTAAQLPAIPKAQWTFAGYDTPEAALQSVMWATSQGDLQSLQAGLSTEAQRTLATELEGKTDDEIATALAQKTSGISTLSFNRRTVGSDGRVTFNISSDNNNNISIVFVKADGTWKMAN